MNRAKFLLVLALLLIAAGLLNLVLAIVDIANGASFGNNAVSAGLGVLLILVGVVEVFRSRGSR